MGMLDGPYWVIYQAGGLEGVVEPDGDTYDKILEVLRDDYRDSSSSQAPDGEFALTLKFDTYTLTWKGVPLKSWYAVNVQKL